MKTELGTALLSETLYAGAIDVPFFPLTFDRERSAAEGFVSLGEALGWRDRLAEISCIKMAVAFFTGELVPLKELLTRAIELGGYRPGIGWSREGMVRLAEIYQLTASRDTLYQDHDRLVEHISAGFLVVATPYGGRRGVAGDAHARLMYAVNQYSYLLHAPRSGDEGKALEIPREEFLKTLSPIGSVLLLGPK